MSDVSIPSAGPGRLLPLAWIAYTIAAIAVIESIVAWAHPTGPFDRTNFLDYRFHHPPDPTRLLFDAKMRELSDSRPTILQVGDSSGFHGIHPPVIEAMLPGARMTNMDIFAFGYPGYLSVMRTMLDRNPSIRVVVLYVTLPALPTPDFTNDSSKMGQDIAKEFTSPLYRLVHLPSLGLRRQVADAVFLGTGGTRESSIADSLTRYPDALALIPQSGGWVREHDNPGDVAQGPLNVYRRFGQLGPDVPDQEVIRKFGKEFAVQHQVFDWMHLRKVNLVEATLDSFRELAEERGVKLVVAMAPQGEVYRGSDVEPRIEAFNRLLEDWRARHAGVAVVPFSWWPNERFSSTEHVATPWTIMASERLGEALRVALGDPAALKADGPAAASRKRVETVVLDERAPVYGFDPVAMREGQPSRAIRAGRDEGLLYLRVATGTRDVVIEPAASVPDDLLSSVSLGVLGEACERLPDETADGRRRLVFRLPPSAMRYDGWLELLVSTRGLKAWPGNELRDGARGPDLALSRLSFR